MLLTAQDFKEGDRFRIKGKIYPRERFEVVAVYEEDIVCRDLNDRRSEHQGACRYIFCNQPLAAYSGRGEIVLDADEAAYQIEEAERKAVLEREKARRQEELEQRAMAKKLNKNKPQLERAMAAVGFVPMNEGIDYQAGKQQIFYLESEQ